MIMGRLPPLSDGFQCVRAQECAHNRGRMLVPAGGAVCSLRIRGVDRSATRHDQRLGSRRPSSGKQRETIGQVLLQSSDTYCGAAFKRAADHLGLDDLRAGALAAGNRDRAVVSVVQHLLPNLPMSDGLAGSASYRRGHTTATLHLHNTLKPMLKTRPPLREASVELELKRAGKVPACKAASRALAPSGAREDGATVRPPKSREFNGLHVRPGVQRAPKCSE
jgi:hypothetical protein